MNISTPLTAIGVFLIVIINIALIYGVWLFIATCCAFLGLAGFNFWLTSIAMTLLLYAVSSSVTIKNSSRLIE
jgi:K+-sensing histidine kinase KdpD